MNARVRTCCGIYREPDHSPGRVEDDRAIMNSVGEALAARGFSVQLIMPTRRPTSVAPIYS